MFNVPAFNDSNVVRGEWKIGIVTKTFPGDEGKVRRVTVSYKNKKQEEKTSFYKGVHYTSIEQPVQQLNVLIPFDGKE